MGSALIFWLGSEGIIIVWSIYRGISHKRIWTPGEYKRLKVWFHMVSSFGQIIFIYTHIIHRKYQLGTLFLCKIFDSALAGVKNCFMSKLRDLLQRHRLLRGSNIYLVINSNWWHIWRVCSYRFENWRTGSPSQGLYV